MKPDSLLASAAAGIGAVAFSLLADAPRLVWNRTASLPPGLYTLSPEATYERGTIVAYRPTPDEADLLEAHRLTGQGWLLVKRAAALDGDEVCRRDDTVLINGGSAALALKHDRTGRPLPVWSGCRRLGPEDILLLADHPYSVDGRYFGVQDRHRVLGALHLIWRHEPDAPAPVQGRT